MPDPQTTTDDISRSLDLASHRSSPWRRRLLWLLLLVLLAGGGIFFWRGAKPAAPLRYKTTTVQRGDLTVIVTATGALEPTNQVQVGSELSGTVRTVAVDYNDRVKVGQVLARLDTAKLEAQVVEAKAVLAAAVAKVEQTKATLVESAQNRDRLRKAKELSLGRITSQQDLDTAEATWQRAKADLAAAQASVAQAQASLDAEQTNLAKSVIYSPINGVVLTRSVEPGQTVAASLQAPVLFTLAEDLTKMELHVDVDEADVGQVREGQGASFTVDAYPDRTFPARITQVRYGAQTVDGVVTYETVLSVDNSDLTLRPGMTATADITVNRVAGALLVPNAALRFTPPAKEEAAANDNQGGSLLSRIFPRPPSHRGGKRSTMAKKNGRKQRLWTLANGAPVAVAVTTGATDGAMTVVGGDGVHEGMACVVDVESIPR